MKGEWLGKIFTFIKRLRIKHALYIVCPINAAHASPSRSLTHSRAAIQIWTSVLDSGFVFLFSVQFLSEALDHDTSSPFNRVQFERKITFATILLCIISFASNIISHLKLSQSEECVRERSL